MSPRHARSARPVAPEVAGSRAPLVQDLVILIAAWLLLAVYVSHGHLVTAYDTFRDMAYTHGILRGELGRDPSLPGLPAWYPAGQPLFFAAIVRVTGASVLSVYGTSLFWLGWLVPFAIHRLLVRAFGRATAWWSLVYVGLGSYWWLTHGSMPMPSIQGVVPGAFTLWAWLAARERGWRAAVGVGALGALAVALHPICGGMAMGTVLLHGVLGPLLARGDAARAVRARRAAFQAGIAFGAWVALVTPILWPLLGGPILNSAPRLWFGPELRDPRFALHAHAPLVLVMGLVGLVRAAASWERAGWLAAYAAIALPPLLAGYAGHELGWPVPWLLPHEFQWHLQLAWCIAAAVAVPDLAAFLAARARRGSWLRPVLAFGLSALVLGPALGHLSKVSYGVLVLDRGYDSVRALAWELTALNASGAVVATNPDVSYVLSGLAGTGAVVLPDGHLNTRAEFAPRLRALSTLMQTEDESVFRAELRRTPVRYLIHLPTDSSQRRRLIQRHEHWSVVKRIALVDSSVLLYSVGDDSRPVPSATRTP